MSVVQSFTDLLKGCSLDGMKTLSSVLADHIANAEKVQNDPSLLIDYEPNLIVNGQELDSLFKEVELLMAKNKSTSHTTSQWLASDSNAYRFGRQTYNAVDITKFPNIMKVMHAVNGHNLSTGDMNGCLVNRYANGDIAGRLHADDEKSMSQISSICTVSLGPDRTIEFRRNSSSPIVKSLNLSNGSMFVMHPGCQSSLKHKVNKGLTSDSVRYSLSFRKAVPEPSISDKTSPGVSSPTSSSSSMAQQHSKPPVVLIAGDSITQRLKSDLIGKNRVKVENISAGGSTFHNTQVALEEYHEKNKDNVDVKKVFISAGCNDIRYTYSRGVQHLKAPITRLMIKVKSLFPNAEIYFHSVLPNAIKNKWTVSNVCGVNNLIRDCCKINKFYYLNVFNSFLTPGGRRNAMLFSDDVHPKRSSMGIIAKQYIRLIHNESSNFNPDVVLTA